MNRKVSKNIRLGGSERIVTAVRGSIDKCCLWLFLCALYDTFCAMRNFKCKHLKIEVSAYFVTLKSSIFHPMNAKAFKRSVADTRIACIYNGMTFNAIQNKNYVTAVAYLQLDQGGRFKSFFHTSYYHSTYQEDLYNVDSNRGNLRNQVNYTTALQYAY